ncbi:UNVERIFIED_CONTAM: hypothetical protein HDU68_002875 [Siphonaria sp. JEL0065]|nr:hypothetical protein HDU68_002875 [Siphonaria sp. JEL0065]
MSKLVAEIAPTTGNTISGRVILQDGRVAVQLKGLAPGSEHGFHIHAFGDATSSNAMAMGGHFNPHGKSHGCGKGFHAGDLGNIVADGSGSLDALFELLEPVDSFVGRGVVVHELKDDCATQPTGNAGLRFAQGVLARAVHSDKSPRETTDDAIASLSISAEKDSWVAFSHESLLKLNIHNLTPLSKVAFGIHRLGFDPDHSAANKDDCASVFLVLAANEHGAIDCSYSLPQSIPKPADLFGQALVLMQPSNCLGSKVWFTVVHFGIYSYWIPQFIAKSPIGAKDASTTSQSNLPECIPIKLDNDKVSFLLDGYSLVELSILALLFVVLGLFLVNSCFRKGKGYTRVGGRGASGEVGEPRAPPRKAA